MAGKKATVIAGVVVVIVVCALVVLQIIAMQKMSGYAAALTQTEQEVKRIEGLCESSTALNRLDAGLTEVRGLCGKLQTGIDDANKALAACQADVNALQTQLKEQDDALQAANQKIGAHAKSFEALRKEVEPLPALQGAVKALQDAQVEQERVLALLKASGLMKDDDATAKKGIRDELLALRNQMMREEMGRLRQTVDDSQKAISATHDDVKTKIAAADKELGSKLGELRTETAALKAKLAGIGDMSTELEAKTASLRDEITKYLSKAFYNSPWDLADTAAAK